MNKRIITTVCILLVLGVAYYFAVNYKPDSDEQEKPNRESIVVFEVPTDTVTRIGIENENGFYAFIKSDDKWKLEGKDVEILSSNVTSLCYSVSYITAHDIINENATDTAMFGLDNPKARVTVTTDKEHTFALGDPEPTGNYYYFADGSKVYTISKTTGDNFLKTQNDYRSKTVTKINAEDVRGIKITGTQENLDVQYAPLPEGQENAYGTLSVWKMQSPVSHSVANDKFTEKIITPACDITAENIVEDFPKDLSKYNFDKKVSIILEDKTVSYKIGTASGVNYVFPEGGTIVYAVASSKLDFLNVKAMDIIDKFLALENIDSIDFVDVDTPNAKGSLKIKRGNDNTYYLDDVFVKEEAFKSMFQIVIGLDADGFVSKSYDTSKLLGTITYHFVKGGTKVLKFYPYDDINIAAQVDGNALFYLKKTKLSDLEGYLGALRANPNERVVPR